MENMVEKYMKLWWRYEREIIIAFIVFFIALLSFGLGFLVGKDSERTPIIIEKYSTE